MCRTVHKKCWSRRNSINPALKWDSKKAPLGFYSFPPPPVSFLWIVVNILIQREIVNSQGWAKCDNKRLDQQQIHTSVLQTHYWVPQNLACPLSKGISVNVPGIKKWPQFKTMVFLDRIWSDWWSGGGDLLLATLFPAILGAQLRPVFSYVTKNAKNKMRQNVTQVNAKPIELTQSPVFCIPKYFKILQRLIKSLLEIFCLLEVVSQMWSNH